MAEMTHPFEPTSEMVELGRQGLADATAGRTVTQREMDRMHQEAHATPEHDFAHAAKATSHELGEAAFQKCRTCRYGEYRPYQGNSKHVAYDVEAIRCREGIIGLPLRSECEWKRRFWMLPVEFTFWLSRSGLKSPNSKARETILRCDLWTQRP